MIYVIENTQKEYAILDFKNFLFSRWHSDIPTAARKLGAGNSRSWEISGKSYTEVNRIHYFRNSCMYILLGVGETLDEAINNDNYLEIYPELFL